MIEITQALTAVGQTLGIVKQLRDIDRDFDAAELKSKMSDIYNDLGDVKIALTDARMVISERDIEIRALKAKLLELSSGQKCPICQEGNLKVVSQKPHEHFAFAGVQTQVLSCQSDDCAHQEERMYDPDNITKTRK